MSIRWIMLVLLVAYGLNAFASIENFNEIIISVQEDQQKLAADLQAQVGVLNEKKPKYPTESKSVASEGFTIRVFNRGSL